MKIIELKKINKSFGQRQLFKDYSLDIEKGSFTLIKGPSGCGKSTLLNILGLLEPIDGGEYLLFGEIAPKPMGRKARKMLFNRIGFLHQSFALLEDKSVFDNLNLALEVGLSKREKEMHFATVLDLVGLSGKEKAMVYTLSGGEQQRLAVARLHLKEKPTDLILADEPTGNLDTDNANNILGLLKKLQEHGRTVVMVSHDDRCEAFATNVITL